MIVFKGKLSEAAVRHEVQQHFKMAWSIVIFELLGVVPMSLLFLVSDNICIDLVIALFILAWSAGIIGAYVAGIFDAKKNISRRIEITEDYAYCEYYEKWILNGAPVKLNRETEQVTDVQDFGEYYIIYFSEIFRTKCFICQKEALIQGSIEEFEKLFEDKLVRQVKE